MFVAKFHVTLTQRSAVNTDNPLPRPAFFSLKVGIVAVCQAAQKVGYGGKRPKKPNRKAKAGGTGSRSQPGGSNEGEVGQVAHAAGGADVVSWKLYLNIKGLLPKDSLRQFHGCCAIKY